MPNTQKFLGLSRMDHREIEVMRISVFGLGKLGLPLAACFAAKGFPVIGVDLDPQKIMAINQGKTLLFEPRLEELIHSSRGQLTATEDYEKAVLGSDVSFIVVPTPSGSQGVFSLQHVIDSCERIGRALRCKMDYHLVVLTSTVMPGSTEKEVKPVLEESSSKICGPDFGLCFSPEFVALGNVIEDFLNPDFFLIGESDKQAGDVLESLYKKVRSTNSPIVRTNLINAELTKLAVNTFVTTKITFANTLARICEQIPGSNIDIITSALGLDSRIGKKYLQGAIGYGGPCFPRDNLAFSWLAKEQGVEPLLAEATDKTNRLQILHLSKVIKSKLAFGGTVGILGLAYKPNTDVVEESQGLLLARVLYQEAIPVIAYDPAGNENARKLLNGSIRFAGCVEECVQESDVIVITTPWKEFRSIEPKVLERAGSPRTIIDCWRLLDPLVYEKIADYVPLGIGVAAAETEIKSGLEDPNL